MSTNSQSVHSTSRGQKNEILKFDPNDYVIIFEQLMNDKECTELFHGYLKQKANSGELLDFLKDYREYFAQYSSLNVKVAGKVENESPTSEEELIIRKKKKVNDFYGMANRMMEKYIVAGSKHEINIGSCRRDTIQRWDAIDKAMKSDIIQTSQGLNQIIELLDPELLFRNSSNLVTADLKFDQFPRFVRSDMVYKFLKRKGERFTRSVALNISQGYNVDIRFKPQELISKKIDDKMIYFGFTLLQDTPDWDCIYDKNQSQVFVSKTNYAFGSNSSQLKLKKMIFTIPYNFDDFWALYVDTDHYQKFKLLDTENYKFCQYIEPNSGRVDQSTGELLDNKVAMTHCESSISMIPFTKPRQFSLITTVIYEPNLDCIIQISPTFRDPNNNVMVIGLSYNFFFRMRDGSTKVILISYTDLKFNIPSFIENRAIIHKTKSYKKTFFKALNYLTCGKTKPVHFTDDPERPWNLLLQVNKSIFPNRSWYKEWMEMTSSE